MKSAYNETWLYNLNVVKEVKRWYKRGFISEMQYKAIAASYTSEFYHSNLIIRVLLFVATLLAISGVTFLFGLTILDAGERGIAMACVFYGLISFLLLETIFIKKNKHYKSGVTEAVLYHSIGFTLGGVIFLTHESVDIWLLISFIVLTIAAIRYIDLICTLAALLVFASLLFYELYQMDGVFRQIIPFAFILVFSFIYGLTRKIKKRTNLGFWYSNIVLVEAVSLLLIYLGGNYFVVRELSVELMNLVLNEDQDIPFAVVFYILTVIIPVTYLYFGVRNKDLVRIRISLFMLAFSVFTFKYYFSLGHPEISLTLAGAVILLITLYMLNYLKVMRNGYTRENLLAEKWGDMNLEAFIISQTMGGNNMNANDTPEVGGGGEFGGGGSTDSF